jgi:hypothetical protein
MTYDANRTVYAQGDVLLLAVPNVNPPHQPAMSAPVILAEGEVTGHRHAFYGGAMIFRDDALAHDIPTELYIGHVKVADAGAVLEHGPGPGQRGDHDPVRVPGGTYIALRQREYTGREADFQTVED